MRQAVTLRKSAPWLARLAFFVLLFQMTAVDHQLGTSDDTADHQQHCHGLVSGCANTGGDLPTVVTRYSFTPSAPSLILSDAIADVAIPADADLAPGKKPPRI